MGLQITKGAKSFTVFCLGNSGQLSVFSAGVVAGATVSTGTITVLHSFDITFDSGSKVILEANLKTRTAPGLPDAVLECDVLLGVEGAAAVPKARRYLLSNPTAAELAIVTAIIDGVLDDLAAASGIPRDRWTAQNAQVGADEDGNTFVTFIIFVRATPSQGASLVENWQVIVEATFDPSSFIFGSRPTNIPENEFPDVTADLSVNLQVLISASLQQLIDEGEADVPDFTGTPHPHKKSSHPASP
jgi:hypothetical protein